MIFEWLVFLHKRIDSIYRYLFEYEWSYAEQSEWPYHYPLWNHCRTSPVTIFTWSVRNLEEGISVSLDYNATATVCRFSDSGHDLRLTFRGDDMSNMLTLRDDLEEITLNAVLQNIHWHTPSEHTIDGRGYAMEMHLVHRIIDPPNPADAKYVVVAAFIEAAEAPDGQTEGALAYLWSRLPHRGDKDGAEIGVVPGTISQMLDARSFFTYRGSLTTPPFEPVVRWVVLRNSLKMSADDIQRYAGYFETGKNARDPDAGGHYRIYPDRHPLAVVMVEAVERAPP